MLNQGRGENQKGIERDNEDVSLERMFRGNFTDSKPFISYRIQYSSFSFSDEAIFKLQNTHSRDGTKENPATSCRQLFASKKNFKSDFYWINPDSGSSNNAIYVFCDHELNATCLLPLPELFENIEVNSEDGQWMSELNHAIAYKTYGKQIRHLQLSSDKVKQRLTINYSSTSKLKL